MAQIHPGAAATARGADADIHERGRSHSITAEASAPTAWIVATDWVPRSSGTLRGFITLRLPSGLVLRDCTPHELSDRRWIGLPGKPLLDQDGRHRVDNAGKKHYVSVVEIPDRAIRERFQAAALAAVDRLRAKGAP
jgi:hypothetical protein